MISLTLTQFTPAQAERLTGNSVTQQRNLRRHGYWEKEAGHARFNVFDLARLLIIQCMSDKGIGPGMIAKLTDAPHDIASICAAGVAWHALDLPEAYEGDANTFVLPGPPPHPRSAYEVELYRAAMAARGKKFEEQEAIDALEWTDRGDHLRRETWRALGLSRVLPAEYFIWWGDGSHVWINDIAEAFGGHKSEPKYHSAIVVLDLSALGRMLCHKAGVAFVHVEEGEV